MFNLRKWVAKTLLVLTGIMPLLRCSSGYQQKDGKITFNGKEITDKSFVVLNDVFAKDSLYAYYKEKSIAGADIASFSAVDDSYAKDKNRVYYCDEFRDGKNYYMTKYQEISVVEKADPASFTLIGASYAKDNRFGFLAGQSFEVKDIATLTGINHSFAKDKVQAYFNRRPVPGSHGKTFALINDYYAKDTGHIYFIKPLETVKESVLVIPCNAASFKVLDYPFSKDDATVFYENVVITGADAASFSILESGYCKDNQAVFIRSKKITGADPATFAIFKDDGQLTQDDYYSSDKDNVYWLDKKLTNADRAHFKPLGHGYGTNGKQIFYKTSVMPQADPNTFKVYPHDVGDADAEDAATKYHSGKRIREE